MKTSYSSEKSIQILIALLKAHGIKRIVTSPGGTNMMLNASLMHDGSFKMVSVVDERSAAYVACGISQESGEPVMITCTGATSSRNYYPGLTEAFYRKLPILVVTGTQDLRRLGNLYDQVTDRTNRANDIVTFSTYISTIRDEKDEENAALKINQAISALTLNGGGPSHINLETIYSTDLSVNTLPDVRVIKRYTVEDKLPKLPTGKIGIFVGSHKEFDIATTRSIDSFCKNHNAVVFCDHTSSYKGDYRQVDALLQIKGAPCLDNIRLTIHIGEVSGDHFNMGGKAKEVWRVNEDGQLRDRYGKLTSLFNMSDKQFFELYKDTNKQPSTDFFKGCRTDYEELYNSIPELPLSNIWMAKTLAPKLPENSAIHFGILTSLRSWNFFEISKTINSACNVGGFGTDGCLSSLLGASIVNPNKLYFCTVGDLAFFYDINSLGNHHLGKNVRILLVNNGKGCEFTHHLNPGHIFGKDVNPFIAADGHNGSKSEGLVRDIAKNLGIKYLCANDKEGFLANVNEFVNPNITQSYIFEVFTKDVDENLALKIISDRGRTDNIKQEIKAGVRSVVGEKGIKILKGFLKK